MFSLLKIANTAREEQVAATAAGCNQVEAQLNQKIGEAERAIAAGRSPAMTNVRSIAADAAQHGGILDPIAIGG